MGRKSISITYDNPPETLENNPFFGLKLDDEQKAFRDAIWNKDKLIVFCNARAGTGKTTIATAVIPFIPLDIFKCFFATFIAKALNKFIY